MGDEEQRRCLLATLKGSIAKASIVERRDDRLAGASRCDYEIAMSVVDLALNFDLLEHLGLVRPRADLESS